MTCRHLRPSCACANISKRLIKSPKLYFHDVGLAAFLCGIEEDRHLKNHPLRGNLFENMVVADLFKQRFNRGRDKRLCFFRDSTGNEVDLLYPLGPDFLPVEIKAGQTVSQDWFRGLKTFRKVRTDKGPPGLIVYGGEQGQRRNNGTVVPLGMMWQEIRELEGKHQPSAFQFPKSGPWAHFFIASTAAPSEAPKREAWVARLPVFHSGFWSETGALWAVERTEAVHCASSSWSGIFGTLPAMVDP